MIIITLPRMTDHGKAARLNMFHIEIKKLVVQRP